MSTALAALYVALLNFPILASSSRDGSLSIGLLSPSAARLQEIYASDAERVSQKFTNRELRRMRYKYDPMQPLTQDQLKRIGRSRQRARLGHPDAPLEIKSGGGKKKKKFEWRTNGKSNGEYIFDQMEGDKARSSYLRQQDGIERNRIHQQTGKKPQTKYVREHKEMMAHAKAGPPDALFIQKDGRHDTKQRTNQQIVQHETEKMQRNRAKARERYYRRKYGSFHIHADNSSKEGPRQTSTRASHSPTSSTSSTSSKFLRSVTNDIFE